jgi:hypothetical protein
MSEVIDGDALLDQINPQLPRTQAFVVLRPDVYEQWKEADALLDEMQSREATDRLAGTRKAAAADIKKQAKLVQGYEDQMRESSTMFEFEALPIEEFQKLVAAHPPRKDNQFDFMAGYNSEAVNEELVRVCLVNMKFTDEGWARLRSKCPPGEWAHLREKALEANRDRVSPPKSLLASRILDRSNAASK